MNTAKSIIEEQKENLRQLYEDICDLKKQIAMNQEISRIRESEKKNGSRHSCEQINSIEDEISNLTEYKKSYENMYVQYIETYILEVGDMIESTKDELDQYLYQPIPYSMAMEKYEMLCDYKGWLESLLRGKKDGSEDPEHGDDGMSM